MIPNKDWRRMRLCREARALLRKAKHGHVIDHRGEIILRKARTAASSVKFTGLVLPIRSRSGVKEQQWSKG